MMFFFFFLLAFETLDWINFMDSLLVILNLSCSVLNIKKTHISNPYKPGSFWLSWLRCIILMIILIFIY